MVVTGIYYALALIGGGLVVSYLSRPAWGAPLYVLALFCLYFFRDPERQIPAGPVAVSPADGKVVAVRPEGPGGTRVSVFLSIFDVHVNRAPVAGLVRSVEYRPGRFHVASREEASAANEQNVVTIDDGESRVVLRQIAGIVARRVVCYLKPGDHVEKGERIGLIRFGSRADVVLGPEWHVTVREGVRVAGGSSVIAKRKAERP